MPSQKRNRNDVYVEIYTDGSCLGNPGPMGIGIVLINLNTNDIYEIGDYIGEGTNNVAEIKAVIFALQLLKDPGNTNVKLHIDSQLIEKFLTNKWKPTKNIELVQEMINLSKKFKKIEIVKVSAHKDVQFNNIADSLANTAAKKRTSIEREYNKSDIN